MWLPARALFRANAAPLIAALTDSVPPLVNVTSAGRQLAGLTLLPALLYFLGAKLDRVRLVPKRVLERRDAEFNFWMRLARSIQRRPVFFL